MHWFGSTIARNMYKSNSLRCTSEVVQDSFGNVTVRVVEVRHAARLRHRPENCVHVCSGDSQGDHLIPRRTASEVPLIAGNNRLKRSPGGGALIVFRLSLIGATKL